MDTTAALPARIAPCERDGHSSNLGRVPAFHHLSELFNFIMTAQGDAITGGDAVKQTHFNTCEALLARLTPMVDPTVLMKDSDRALVRAALEGSAKMLSAQGLENEEDCQIAAVLPVANFINHISR